MSKLLTAYLLTLPFLGLVILSDVAARKQNTLQIQTEWLLGDLRNGGNGELPTLAIEDEFQLCHDGVLNKSSSHRNIIESLLNEFRKLSSRFETQFSEALATQRRLQGRLEYKTVGNRKLQQQLITSEFSLSRRFDCVSSRFTRTSCDRFCYFPNA